MRRFGICLGLPDNIHDFHKYSWKSFYPELRQAKGNSGKLENIYEIQMFPAEAVRQSRFHMIISYNENTKHLEDMFNSRGKADKILLKNKLTVSMAEVLPIWKIFRVNKADNNREKVYEASV